jgi:dipeptidase E
MKLVLLSDSVSSKNHVLDTALLAMAGKNAQITYIPSDSYDSDVHFRDFVYHYQRLGAAKFLHFPVDVPTDSVLAEEAFNSDIIYLEGGNTFYFLNHLRRGGWLGKLRRYVKEGGILVGASAGAIIMTPNIQTAAVPKFTADENLVGIANLNALNLTGFVFAPHYVKSVRFTEALLRYSKRIANPILSCKDGDGIIIDDDSIRLVGTVYCFYRGHYFEL